MCQIDTNNLNKKTKTKMNKNFILVSMVAILAIAFCASFAVAADYNIVEPTITIDGNEFDDFTVSPVETDVAVVAGDIIPVTIEFTAPEFDETDDATFEVASDVEVSAWISGYKSETRTEVERNYDYLAGNMYKEKLSLKIPSDIDETEDLTLYVRIETDEGNWEQDFVLNAQRESYNLDVFLAEFDSTVKVGATLPVSVVVKNIGYHETEDVLVTVKIPALGVSKIAYFEDLYPVDGTGDDDDDEDARERRVFVSIPANAEPGIYEVEITAESDDSDFAKMTVKKSLVVTGTPVEGKALSNPASKTFAVGEKASYELILVNTGSKVAVYNVAPAEVDGLTVTVSDELVVVPAGSSKTVKVFAKASREGTFNFDVTATSEGIVKTAGYTSSVEGKSFGGASNNVVVLTVVLAIIFVVLLIILIVLLTRKPETSEEFGESYY